MTLASLSEAIDWLRDKWAEQRPAPIKLHGRDPEGVGLTRDKRDCGCLACTAGPADRGLGSPAFSPSMAAALDGSDDAVSSAPRTVSCYHPLISAGMSPRDCPECLGMGIKDARVDRYIYPMSRALGRLHKSLGPGRQPHPYAIVIELAAHGFDPHLTAASNEIPWDRAEALFLMSIRRLHSHYAEGPVTTRTSGPKWTEMSESQQNAETAA